MLSCNATGVVCLTNRDHRCSAGHARHFRWDSRCVASDSALLRSFFSQGRCTSTTLLIECSVRSPSHRHHKRLVLEVEALHGLRSHRVEPRKKALMGLIE